MWYFILALLFGNPSNTNTSNDQIVTLGQSDNNDPKTGGDNGPVRPK